MSKGLALCVAVFLSFSLKANDLELAPPHLDDQGLVFVDFKKVHYQIRYLLEEEETSVVTEIRFSIPKKGKALFDLVYKPKEAFIDGYPIEIGDTILGDGISRMKFANKEISKGTHVLKMKHSFYRYVKFQGKVVQSAFWMSDLSDRSFLESFLPTNLDYDRYQMSFDVKVQGTETPHKLKINCRQKEVEPNHFQAVCPKYFNSSLLFYHLFEEGRFKEETRIYTSIDGREIPIIAYSKNPLGRYFERVLKVMKELEEDYGPWPHPEFLIYAAGRGGMEYAGATQTSFYALGHEMHHSYFARSMRPALGNAGWIDEALASWRDNGYERLPRASNNKTKMAGHSVYRRSTDSRAYSKGARLMAHLDHRFSEQGGLRAFLKDWFSQSPRASFSTEHFRDQMGAFYNDSLVEFFDTYIYGKNSIMNFSSQWANPMDEINHYHPKLSENELLELL